MKKRSDAGKPGHPEGDAWRKPKPGDGLTGSLSRELKIIEEAGIRADRRNLTRDMCAQFTDQQEWIREFVANAYDARATRCEIFGYENDMGNETVICVRDNGHGMDLRRLTNFFTLYRSDKTGGISQPVGQFGIGKISVAAVPGQCGFYVHTSDGQTCHVAETGSFLDNGPIHLYEVTPVPPPGTLFRISFRRKRSLGSLLEKLTDLLYRYTRFLPMEIIVYQTWNGKTGTDGDAFPVNEPWDSPSASFGAACHAIIEGHPVEIRMSIGKKSQEIFRNRILIGEQYNLLSHGTDQELDLPWLGIRVDSPGFDLPFGRHCLNNEEILTPIAAYIRENVFPCYWDKLMKCISGNKSFITGFSVRQFEDLAVALVKQWPDLDKTWCHVPVFNLYPNRKRSLADLEVMVTTSGILYLAPKDGAGLNFAGFNGPVLLADQPAGCLDLLKKFFVRHIIDLSEKDIVFIAPESISPILTQDEMILGHHLGFHDILTEGATKGTLAFFREAGSGNTSRDGYYDSPEAEKVGNAFARLSWEVRYLVNRDLSPCLSHRFIMKEDTVVLNLYHPDIRRLVSIARRDAKLAGHWAVAMCLAEDSRILPHLRPESREDLLILDALARLILANQGTYRLDHAGFLKMKRSFYDLLNNIDLN